MIYIDTDLWWVNGIIFVCGVALLAFVIWALAINSTLKEVSESLRKRQQALADIRQIDPAIFEVFSVEGWGERRWAFNRLHRVADVARQRTAYTDGEQELKEALAALKEARK